MKFYKLELINREHSYNNMFGNNPNVGLINPMQAATKVGKVNSTGITSTGAMAGLPLPRKKTQI